jgi:hypothetical protein
MMGVELVCGTARARTVGCPSNEEAYVPTLTEPVRLDIPGRMEPVARVDGPTDVPADPTPPRRRFDLGCRDGFLRAIVGSIAYLDEEARTYMVRTDVGLLVHVPFGDIHEADR